MVHLRLRAVEIELEVRRLRVVAGERHQDVRIRIELREQLLLELVDLHRVGVRLVLDVDGYAVGHSKARNRRRHEDLPLRLWNRREHHLDASDERGGVLLWQRTLVPALEVDDESRLVLAAAADHAPPGDGQHAFHLRQLTQHLHAAKRDVARAVARGAFRHLHRREYDALVFVGEERGLRLHEERDRAKYRKNEQHAGEKDSTREPLCRGDEEPLELLDRPVEPRQRTVPVRIGLAKKQRAERGGEGKRAYGGEADSRRKRHGELLVDATRDAAHEADRNEDAEQHERRCYDSARHVAHRLYRRLPGVQSARFDEELDAFHDDDAVVHYDADRENQSEQREDVYRVS